MSYLDNPELFAKLFSQLWTGFQTTLSLFSFTLLFSLPLGMLIAILRMSKFKPLSFLTSVFILIMRGTPLMLQLFAVYFFLPKLLQLLAATFFLPSLAGSIPRITATLIAFSLNYAAYFAEIYRGGIMSIDKGQYEAGRFWGSQSPKHL